MKRYAEHHCNHPHRNERAFMRCAIRPRVRITGEGPYVVVTRCGLPSAQLHGTLESAAAALQDLDRDGCDTGCASKHELGRIDPAELARSAA